MKLERLLPMPRRAKYSFATPVVLGLLQALWELGADLGWRKILAVTSVSALYVTTACWDRARERLGDTGYLVLQHALALLLPWLSHARMFMAPLPVVSHSGLGLSIGGVLLLAGMHALNVGSACLLLLPNDKATFYLFMFLGALVFVLVFTELLANELRLREQLSAASEKLAAYAAQAEELATHNERNRIARELHDSLGHTFTTTHVHLLVAERELESSPQRAQIALATAQRTVREGLSALRQTVRALHSTPSQAETLEQSLARLAKDLNTDTLSTSMHSEGTTRPLPPHIALAVFRTAQEALTNVQRHANAKSARVTVHYATDQITLTVRDDGVGLPSALEPGFGLRGLRERAELLGGTLSLENQDGVILTLTVPA